MNSGLALRPPSQQISLPRPDAQEFDDERPTP